MRIKTNSLEIKPAYNGRRFIKRKGTKVTALCVDGKEYEKTFATIEVADAELESAYIFPEMWNVVKSK